MNNNLAALLLAERDFASAEKYFRAAIRCDPANAEAYSNLGGMLTDLGKPDEALPLLHRATQLKPDDANAHHNLGAAYAALKMIPEARTEYETAVRLNPRHDPAHFKLGDLCLDARQRRLPPNIIVPRWRRIPSVPGTLSTRYGPRRAAGGGGSAPALSRSLARTTGLVGSLE